MATKAEQFRYWTERSGPKKPKSPPRARRDSEVDTSLAGVRTDRKGAPRRSSAKAGKKAAYALETSAGKPSRKSTRKAGNRQRTDTKMVAKSRTERVRPPSRGTPHSP